MNKNGFYRFPDRNRFNAFCNHLVVARFLAVEKITESKSLLFISFSDLSNEDFEQLRVIAESFQGVYEPVIKHVSAQRNPAALSPDSMGHKFETNEDYYDSSDPEIRKIMWFILGVVAIISLFVFFYTH